MMIFEYDHIKNLANQEKHGISFNEAEAVWSGIHVIIPAKTVDGEDRHAVIGNIEGKCWVAIVQYKNAHKQIRIISVRRARKKEEEYYESERTKYEYY